MVGYVAGQPFPLIDANDPFVANKVIWNNVFRPIQSDDYDLRYFDCQSEYIRPGKEQQIIDNIDVGHYAGYNLVGRTEVEPLPIDPDFKKTGRFWLFALYPVLAPAGCARTGHHSLPLRRPKRGDDSWDWNPGSRRVRRLNEALLSTATGAQTFDPDHYSGFNPKTEQYDYKFLGEKELLASVHAAHSPEVTCATDGGASACPENWELSPYVRRRGDSAARRQQSWRTRQKDYRVPGFRSVVRALHRHLRPEWPTLAHAHLLAGLS